MSKVLFDYIIAKEHHKLRVDNSCDLASEYKARGLSPIERMSDRFERLMKLQTPHILPEEKIVFVRTTTCIPDCFTEDEWAEIKKDHYIHELGYISNLNVNFEKVIKNGLIAFKGANEYADKAIDLILDLADRYKAEAIRVGRNDIAETLEKAPRYGAKNFREALQLFRIIHFSMWLEGNYHNTVGRFDKYMYPYFKADLERGVYTYESALELIEDFFLSFNKDSDMYVGVQQGDNGQSMVLGGVDENGKDVFSELSKMCLEASRNLKLIDPKINLRVTKDTPDEIFELGTELTKAGLGFPQYENDDVAIPALEKLGYSHEDASNYVVAACWEFIIPGCAFDIVNIAAMSYPKAVNDVMYASLEKCATYDEFFGKVKDQIKVECDKIMNSVKNVWFVPSPFLEGVMLDPIKYRNYGVHGTGHSTAVDSLAAIKKYVFDEKTVSATEMVKAVKANFEGYPELLARLRNDTPKLGMDDDYVDNISIELMDSFAKCFDGKKNCQGGIWRAGTGSAMYYLWHANEIGASADGRLANEPFGANFAPSLFAKVGPVSVIKSFSKQHFENVMNGGPLTIEFHNSVFRDADGISKVAKLVKYFITLGGHQLQLNSVNLETMKEAQKHPEDFTRLVVRIWGWSAYFVELDREYQDHVIRRQEYDI
ncbi:MAG: pyruvate formate-lyase [Ruminococcaceae bacterium]|nr:pyruvate formate-lyase [Oscillospiraceae bacterium]